MTTPPGTETRRIGVILERRKATSPWIEHVWRPVQVLDGTPQSEPWTVVAEGDGWVHFYAGAAEVSLYRHESETYAYNLNSRMPAVWIFLRNSPEPGRVELYGASVDPGEAHAHNDTGDDIVDFVPMPDGMREWMRGYIERNPPRTERYKRKRDKADPEALARRAGLYASDPLRQTPEDE
ncbi:DUF3305 domain-containing protein [Sphingomonas daechungensis]|uniref:DUF3305 domain-containing protein n=1 Tax=Sphingomonas daechungensis TaxID=1176646 RepID=UPI001A56547D|nr:DUF3305 domain-containing protein [Rhodospirillales bacterium]